MEVIVLNKVLIFGAMVNKPPVVYVGFFIPFLATLTSVWVGEEGLFIEELRGYERIKTVEIWRVWGK